jgi:predicted  nucleic acid-binding Zn-ribbon protein
MPKKTSVPKKTTCVKCGRVLDAMDVFPGNVCLSCYERAFDGVGTEEQKLEAFQQTMYQIKRRQDIFSS